MGSQRVPVAMLILSNAVSSGLFERQSQVSTVQLLKGYGTIRVEATKRDGSL